MCDNPNCGHAVKVLVPDWMKTLEKKCPQCGGTMKKT